MIYNPKVSQLAETLDVRGNWSFAGDGVDSLLWKYQVPMYSDIFLERLGMFEFTVDMSRLLKRLAEVGPGSRRYLFAGGGWYRIYPEGAVPQRAEADTLLNASIGQIGAAWREGASFSGGGALVNSMPLPELDAVLLSVTEKNPWKNLGGFGPQTLFIGVLFAALSALYYMLISSLSNIAELKKREADFLALQAQIRPHFLYNSLETARMIADSNGDEEAGDFLFNLGRFVRFSFSSAEKDIPLETELEIVEKYLYLYKTSMGNRLEYTVEKDAEASNVICPPFIVQPLVENSLHHAFGENAQRLTIAVSVKIEKGAAVITVRDDGKGIPGEKIEGLLNKPVEDDAPVRRYVKGSGLGLSNTNRRLKEFFGGRAVLTVESEAGKGTVCTITIWEEL
jgi:anti-sigma regulatory factor (Ser/Thr protein kinase)